MWQRESHLHTFALPWKKERLIAGYLEPYWAVFDFTFSFGDKTEMFRPVMVEPSPEYLEATWK